MAEVQPYYAAHAALDERFGTCDVLEFDTLDGIDSAELAVSPNCTPVGVSP